MRHDRTLHTALSLRLKYPDRVTILAPSDVQSQRTARGWVLSHQTTREAPQLQQRCEGLLSKRHHVAIGLQEDGSVAVFSRAPSVTIDATTAQQQAPLRLRRLPLPRISRPLSGLLAVAATATIAVVSMGAANMETSSAIPLNDMLSDVLGGQPHRLQFARVPVVDQEATASALNTALLGQMPILQSCPYGPSESTFSVQLHVRQGTVQPRLLTGSINDTAWACVEKAMQEIPSTESLPAASISFFSVAPLSDGEE